MSRFTSSKFVSVSAVSIAFGVGIAVATPAQAAWSTPVKPSAACTPASGLNIALNTTGAWILVGTFTQSDGSGAVESCTSSDGVNWTGPSMVGPGGSPAVAIAPNGRAVVAFSGLYPALNIQASVRPPGGSWTAPVVIYGGPISGHALIKMDGSGNAIAIWEGGRDADAFGTASLAANSTTWTPPTTLAAHAGSAGFAVNSTGGVVIGFRNDSPDKTEAVSGTVLGGFGAPVIVGGNYGTAIRPIQVALNDSGVAVLGWVTDDYCKVVTRTPGGTWSTPTQLDGNNAEGVGVAIDASGNAIAGFGDNQPGINVTTAVYGTKMPAGGAWGTPTLLSTLDAKGHVTVGGDPAGTFVVTWLDASSNVEALTIPPGGGFGPGTVVGAGGITQLIVIPGQAVLSIAAGISKEPIN